MIVQGKSLCMVPHLGVGLLIKYEMLLDLIKIYQLWISRDGKDPVILYVPCSRGIGKRGRVSYFPGVLTPGN